MERRSQELAVRAELENQAIQKIGEVRFVQGSTLGGSGAPEVGEENPEELDIDVHGEEIDVDGLWRMWCFSGGRVTGFLIFSWFWCWVQRRFRSRRSRSRGGCTRAWACGKRR